MSKKVENQFEFPSVLYDTLFGLVIYFSIASVLDINDLMHLFYYLFTIVVIIHWWLMFKSAADEFGEETKDSVMNMVINIIVIVLLQYFVMTAAIFDLTRSILFLIAVVVIDIFWALLWLYAKPWQTKVTKTIKRMNNELVRIIKIDGFILISLIATLTLSLAFSPSFIAMLCMAFYLLYIIATFKWKIIELNLL